MSVPPTRRKTSFVTAQLSRRGFLAAGVAGGFALAALDQPNTQPQSSRGAATKVINTSNGEAGVIPYSSNIEFPNPMRGQYEDLLVAEHWQGTSYPGTDNYQRYVWADIHTGPNTFDGGVQENSITARLSAAPISTATPKAHLLRNGTAFTPAAKTAPHT